jgi:hypothetical protein
MNNIMNAVYEYSIEATMPKVFELYPIILKLAKEEVQEGKYDIP